MQIEIKGFIHAQVYSHKPDQPEFSFAENKSLSFLDSEYSTYVTVMPYTFTVDVGDFKVDYREARVASLQKEETKLRADFAKRCAEINSEISKLQAITFDAEVQS